MFVLKCKALQIFLSDCLNFLKKHCGIKLSSVIDTAKSSSAVSLTLWSKKIELLIRIYLRNRIHIPKSLNLELEPNQDLTLATIPSPSPKQGLLVRPQRNANLAAAVVVQ